MTTLTLRADCSHCAPPEPLATPNGPDLVVTVVDHRPAPQGSKKKSKSGAIIDDNPRTKPWRTAVEDGITPLDGPLSVEVVFTVRKPASAPKTRATWPATRDSGDIDKLLRSTFDALTTGGAIADDSRVVEVTARKVHPGEGIDALDTPGAVIRIWRLS